jgi:hypothetical protein
MLGGSHLRQLDYCILDTRGRFGSQLSVPVLPEDCCGFVMRISIRNARGRISQRQ